jgi:hypothetical protein
MLTGLAGGAIVPSATAAEPEGTADTPVVVTLPQRALLRSLSVPVTSSSAAAAAPYTVARDTQSELHRVGCYDGEISGIWTPATRSAAQRFVDRVNAKLPIDKPDDVLLSLLRGQSGAVCGQCQVDQTQDAAGRCVPTALINKASRPRVIGAETAPESPRAEASPPAQAPATPERVYAAVSRRFSSQPYSGQPKSWNSFIRQVDRALGLQ